MRAALRSDDDDRTGVEQRPARGGEGAGLPEGDLGQASLTSCCLKLDTRAPLLPSTWIAYLRHSRCQHSPGSSLIVLCRSANSRPQVVLRLTTCSLAGTRLAAPGWGWWGMGGSRQTLWQHVRADFFFFPCLNGSQIFFSQEGVSAVASNLLLALAGLTLALSLRNV